MPVARRFERGPTIGLFSHLGLGFVKGDGSRKPCYTRAAGCGLSYSSSPAHPLNRGNEPCDPRSRSPWANRVS